MGKISISLLILLLAAPVTADGRPDPTASTSYWWEQEQVKCMSMARGVGGGDWVLVEVCKRPREKKLKRAQEGSLKDGKKHGRWQGFDRSGRRVVTDEYRAGRLVKRIPFRAGKLHGKFDFWYPDGSRHSIGEYRNGVPTGSWIRWWNNGRMKIRGQYLDGQKHGTWSWWCQDGHPLKQVEYRHGQVARRIR